MRFAHRFRVGAPIEAVADFDIRAASLVAITPPPIVMRLDAVPDGLGEGDTMRFTMWLGPVPIQWTARIEAVSLNGFTDRQLAGPFAQWSHRRTFVALSGSDTEVVEEVEARLRAHPWWGLLGLGMWLSLRPLFALRAHRTRRLLEGP